METITDKDLDRVFNLYKSGRKEHEIESLTGFDIVKVSRIEDFLSSKGLLEEYANQKIVTIEGRNFKGFEMTYILELRLKILQFLEPSYLTGKHVQLGDLLIVECPEYLIGDIGLILKSMCKTDGYISENGVEFRGLMQNQRLTVKQFLDNGNTIPLKILKPGYEILHPALNNLPSNTFNIHGSVENLINASPGASIKVNSKNLSEALPQIIDLFNQIRTEDMTLFAAALKDAQEGKEQDATKLERIMSFASNIVTIAGIFVK